MSRNNERYSMDLKKQIFELLEPEEKARFMIQKKQERFEQQCRQFINHVVSPVFKEIKEEFSRYGRSVDIAMGGFSNIIPGFYPKLHITVPGGRIFKYWVEVKQKEDKFCVKRFRSIEGEGEKPKVFKISLPQGRQLLDDLSEVNEEYIQRDIIEVYQGHIMMNTIPR
jgi:hypothetical protein